MILLSNLIKSSRYVDVDDKKVIHVIPIAPKVVKEKAQASAEEVQASSVEDELTNELENKRSVIMKEAEQAAEALLQQAVEEAEQLKLKAEEEINGWWEDRRSLDKQHEEEVREKGYQEGYAAGVEQAEEDVRNQYSDSINEAQSILEQAQHQKQRIIQEAEPFLLEMSSAISERIIEHQLTLEPEWIIEIISRSLKRKREQGTITLCVSPAYYSYIQDAEEELALSIDSQAELLVVPDTTVEDHGCVIRSSLGSIDATIDTQLSEIKNALHQIALRYEDAAHDE